MRSSPQPGGPVPPPDEPAWVKAVRAFKESHLGRTEQGEAPAAVIALGGEVLGGGWPPAVAYHPDRDDLGDCLSAAAVLHGLFAPESVVVALESYYRAVPDGDLDRAYAEHVPGSNAERFRAGDPAIERRLVAFRVSAAAEPDHWHLPYFYCGAGTRFAWLESGAGPAELIRFDWLDELRRVFRWETASDHGLHPAARRAAAVEAARLTLATRGMTFVPPGNFPRPHEAVRS